MGMMRRKIGLSPITGRVNQVGLRVAVLKTVGCNSCVSSSLTSSAIQRAVRVAYCATLLRW